MAIYHLSVKNVSRTDKRGGGEAGARSAVAAAAYRAGVRLRNIAEDRVANFSKRGGVVHSEILLPEPRLDPDRDRDIRIQFFQARNRILESLDPREVASSELPEQRIAALLSVAARYSELREQGRER